MNDALKDIQKDTPKDRLKMVSYESLTPGPTMVVLGVVHGNEPCGREAIERIAADIEADRLPLSAGRLMMVPVCNPKAYRLAQRCVERNLNRHLYIKEQAQAYEDWIDPVLCRLLDQADVLLDLHSYASPGGPFIFLGGHHDAERALAFSLGVQDFVQGWAEAFATQADSQQGRLAAMGTTEYVRERGGISVTLECGSHTNPNNADVGARAIVRALQHLNMVAQSADTAEQDNIRDQAKERRLVTMKTVFYKEKSGQLARAWQHLDAVAKGELLATYEEGEQIRATEQGVMVLPKAHAPVGGEWFYLGTV